MVFILQETSYETERKTWEEARKFCQRFGGDLVSYNSIEEEQFSLGLAWAHQQGFWIGMRRHLHGDEFKWNDGTDVEYVHWADGEPKLSSPTKYCVVHSEKWELSYCGTRRYFICEAPFRIYPDSSTPDGAVLFPQKEDPECNFPGFHKWLLFSDHCYLFEVTKTYSWKSAQLFCADNEAYPVSIHSYKETDFLLGAVSGTQNFWVGLHAESIHSEFKWADRSPLDFVFWDENSLLTLHGMHRCVMLNKFTGYWTIEHCNTLLSVICKKAYNSTSSSLPPSLKHPSTHGYCPDNWYPLGINCFRVFGYKLEEKESWSKASNSCINKGAMLASVHNQNEQDMLTEFVLEVGYSAWIGLHAIVRGSVFEWIDNSTFDFTNWNEDEPYHNGMEEDCVEMMHDEMNMGKWNDVICSRPKAYICQRPRDLALYKPGSNPRICSKPNGWRKLGSSCFNVFGSADNNNKASWLDAQSYCRHHRAHLATVKTYGNTIFLKRLFASIKINSSSVMIREAFWIGAREKEKNTYAWISSLPLSYSNWLSGQPQTVHHSHGNCVATNSDGKWFVTNCEEKHSFVCEYLIEEEKRCSNSSSDVQLVCPNSTLDWHDIPGNYCFLFELYETRTWNEAMYSCFMKGGSLASFHSKTQLSHILPYTENSEWPLHIGLGQMHDGEFAWVDGSAVNFLNWEEGEPNSNSEYCVEMHPAVLTWNDVYCDATRGYICSIPKVPLAFENATYAGAMYLSTGGIIGTIAFILIFVTISFVSYCICYKRRYHLKCAERLYVNDCL